MPRYPRLFLTGYPLHIVQRGHDRQPVFASETDYLYYIDNLRDEKVLLDIRVFAYCLMTNHVHLVLQPDSEPEAVSKLMKVLGLARRAGSTGSKNAVERSGKGDSKPA